MTRLNTPGARIFLALLTSMTFAAFNRSTLADDGRIVHRRHDEVDPRRGQYDYVRDGLGPALLPYTHHGHTRLKHRYPAYPLFRSLVPGGPGDHLYETGRFPWRRG